jgi:hypothetical protein
MELNSLNDIAKLLLKASEEINIQLGYMAAVPLRLRNMATDTVIAHSRKAMPSAQPPNILTVETI